MAPRSKKTDTQAAGGLLMADGQNENSPAATLPDTAFCTVAEVCKFLGITEQEHHLLTATPDYPKPQYEGSNFVGYKWADVERYASQFASQAAESVTESSSPVVADPAADAVEVNSVEIPTTSLDQAASLAFSRGFSAQWSTDDMARWKKLISGLVRSNQTYLSYQGTPQVALVSVRSNIQDALRWLLRRAVPLSYEELQAIGMDGKIGCSENERYSWEQSLAGDGDAF